MCASSELEVNGPSTKLNFAVNFNVEETQIVLGDSQEKELGCLFVLLSAIRIPQQCPTVLLLYELLELLQDSFNEYSKFGPIGGRGQLNWVLFSKCTRRSVPLNNAAPVLLKIIPLNIRSSRLFACPSSNAIGVPSGKFNNLLLLNSFSYSQVHLCAQIIIDIGFEPVLSVQSRKVVEESFGN